MDCWTADDESVYRYLTYTTDMLLGAEQVFPNWENIHALIASGLLVLYFTAGQVGIPERLGFCFIGIVFCVNWLRLVSRNYLYTLARAEQIAILEKALRREVVMKGEVLTLFDLEEFQSQFIRPRLNFWNRKGTWYVRRDVPKHLLVIWALVVVYTLSPIISQSGRSSLVQRHTRSETASVLHAKRPENRSPAPRGAEHSRQGPGTKPLQRANQVPR